MAYLIGSAVVIQGDSDLRIGHVAGVRELRYVAGVSQPQQLTEDNVRSEVEYILLVNGRVDDTWYPSGRVFDNPQNVPSLAAFWRSE